MRAPLDVPADVEVPAGMEHLLCPISHSLMRQPVMLVSEQLSAAGAAMTTYDYDNIATYLTAAASDNR